MPFRRQEKYRSMCKQLDLDMLSISAHKMHGPKGAGVLYVRHGIRFSPLIHGGRQERGRRAGTENTAAIVGFGLAAEIAAQAMPREMPRISLMRDRLEREILRLVPGSMLIGDSNDRLPNTLSIAFEDLEADAILLLLDRAASQFLRGRPVRPDRWSHPMCCAP
jgi:cysteine desulfurase